MNISDERRAQREDEHLYTVAACIVLALLCIGLALIQPEACNAVDGKIPALCAD